MCDVQLPCQWFLPRRQPEHRSQDGTVLEEQRAWCPSSQGSRGTTVCGRTRVPTRGLAGRIPDLRARVCSATRGGGAAPRWVRCHWPLNVRPSDRVSVHATSERGSLRRLRAVAGHTRWLPRVLHRPLIPGRDRVLVRARRLPGPGRRPWSADPPGSGASHFLKRGPLEPEVKSGWTCLSGSPRAGRVPGHGVAGGCGACWGGGLRGPPS